MDLKGKILEEALSLFLHFGVRSVSMDDVARELSVSKKTLYQHFKNKDELVTESMKRYLTEEQAGFTGVINPSNDPVEQLYSISKCLRKHVHKLNPSLIYDLQKYHAGAWDIFEQFKDLVIIRLVEDILARGVAEGYFRQEINPVILSVLRMEIVRILFSGQAYPRTDFDPEEVQRQVFELFIHGILSEKGRIQYLHYQSNENSLK